MVYRISDIHKLELNTTYQRTEPAILEIVRKIGSNLISIPFLAISHI